MMGTLKFIWDLVTSLCLIGLAFIFFFYAFKHKPLDPSDVYYTMAILLMTIAGRDRAA